MTGPTQQPARPSQRFTSVCSRCSPRCSSCPWPSPRAPRRSSTGRTSTTDSIGRANLDGTGVNQSFITGASRAAWASRSTPRTSTGPTRHTDAIGRANLDGTGVDQSFITTGRRASRSIAVDAAHVYWTNWPAGNRARSAAPTSTARASTRASSPALSAQVASRSTPTHIYWTNRRLVRTDTDAIGRANLDGTGVDRASSPAPSGYRRRRGGRRRARLLEPGLDPSGTIGRANLDGSGVDQSFIAGVPRHPAGLAVDAAHVYWTTRLRHDRARQPRRLGRRAELHHHRAGSPASRSP